MRKHVKVPNSWTRIEPKHQAYNLPSPCTLPYLCMDVVGLWQGQVFKSSLMMTCPQLELQKLTKGHKKVQTSLPDCKGLEFRKSTISPQ